MFAAIIKRCLVQMYCDVPSDKRPLVCLRCSTKNETKRRLDNAVAGTSKILSFFVTTTAGEDDTSTGNPENSNRDAVDVAPSEPAPEDGAAAEPAPANEAAAEPTTSEPATAEPTTAEPARRGPVVQELDLTLDSLSLKFQLGSSRVHWQSSCNRQFSITSSDTIHVAQKDHPKPTSGVN